MASNEGTRDFFRVIAAYLLPPLGVFLQVGLGTHFWINLILTFLGGLPGVLHAVWVIASVDEHGGQAKDAMPTFIALILAAFLPPVAVFLRAGAGQALLNALLTLFFWIPGVLHAVWVIVNAPHDPS